MLTGVIAAISPFLEQLLTLRGIVTSVISIVIIRFTYNYFFPYYIPGIPVYKNTTLFGMSLVSAPGKFDSHEQM